MFAAELAVRLMPSPDPLMTSFTTPGAVLTVEPLSPSVKVCWLLIRPTVPPPLTVAVVPTPSRLTISLPLSPSIVFSFPSTTTVVPLSPRA
ncbi:hypothetical protein FV232_25100 [Methylobacterium sp. WL30]|nr:hypothetical protein FV223_04720 [Methylobacterium sp. WL116]TXN36522.1 hypothetical protein FV225_14605 [Methylobacterium sp. WL93]TXN46290.1 hypothetical protein FV227_23610 [Methylobacterium sp. WL119]TXN62605.1 hypothetical protein FV232_25100 [Methylobacterium sp. WL30]